MYPWATLTLYFVFLIFFQLCNKVEEGCCVSVSKSIGKAGYPHAQCELVYILEPVKCGVGSYKKPDAEQLDCKMNVFEASPHRCECVISIGGFAFLRSSPKEGLSKDFPKAWVRQRGLGLEESRSL